MGVTGAFLSDFTKSFKTGAGEMMDESHLNQSHNQQEHLKFCQNIACLPDADIPYSETSRCHLASGVRLHLSGKKCCLGHVAIRRVGSHDPFICFRHSKCHAGLESRHQRQCRRLQGLLWPGQWYLYQHYLRG